VPYSMLTHCKDSVHYLVELDEHGNTIGILESFEDWGLAVQESGLLNSAIREGSRRANKFGTLIAGYEIVTE